MIPGLREGTWMDGDRLAYVHVEGSRSILKLVSPGESPAVLREWNFAPAIDATTFAFSPPDGVKKVAFREAPGAQGGGK